ncbi:MAG: alpha-amylase [Chlorobiaceae bacterium]|nr:alpha-amylase [Chlorobiaceae bacterium]
MNTDTLHSVKEHYYINRAARSRYHLDDPALLQLPKNRREALTLAEQQTESINRRISLVDGDQAKKILPAQFHAMKLLHELLHHLIEKVTGLPEKALGLLNRDTSRWHTMEYLGQFLELFPPDEVYLSGKSPEAYLHDGKHLKNALEEAFLVWLNNQNPALEPFSVLLSDSELRSNAAYPHLVRAMTLAMQAAGPVGDRTDDLDELLTLPFRHAPNSLLAQLRFISMNWKDILGDSPWWPLLDEAIVLVEDENRYLFFENLAHERGHTGGGKLSSEHPIGLPEYADLGDAPARYSHDSSWMPEVVMIAKSTYVWLWQLSRKYQHHISRLQDIPDEELDQLASSGFTALWLIGLWQRSHASQKIKQLLGNAEAKASAYALEKYEIADEIGGYDGYTDLRNRAMARGIRLASDMVPNHTGIDSELVRQRPEWFLSTNEPPYPNYTYNGPNLSADNRYAIHIEDGYWNRSDAAVTFRRIDYLTGDTRYLYHGNDGTIMPWNDTAQLNFLDPEVREGVIRQILNVAKMFPIIRFDAAMVLAKMHIQRLWYPLTGHTAGVPSRGAWSMSMADFEAAIPEEFWREVVDRVAHEVPETLLLAEAFWMLEGYFVRTLGMHRVYNSAFMHMLKKEDNAGYRQLIKKTLEFDAEILKRYVNFMNNPDEDTAIAQFGKGDKYFGVCMMMITLPGLPMFGHGQVEGLTEKYGMEYARAYYDEMADEVLVHRHEREIFPVIKKRALFAEVSNFHLFDLYTASGSVEENVFAYCNHFDSQSALFIFNNRYEASDGWIRISSARLENGSLTHSGLADALRLPGDHDAYLLFREQRSGLEFIRQGTVIRENGLHIALNGYEYNLFLDFSVVRPTKLRPYDRVCQDLDGRGVSSIELATLSMSLRPVHLLVASGLDRIMSEPPEGSNEEGSLFGSECRALLESLSERFAEIMEKTLLLPPGIAETASSNYLILVRLATVLDKIAGTNRIKAALGIGSETFLPMARTLITLAGIQKMLEYNGLLEEQVIDQWMLGETLKTLLVKKSTWPAHGTPAVDLFSCLLSLWSLTESDETPDERIMCSIRTLFESGDSHFRNFMQLQLLHDREWFRERQLTMIAAWLMVQALLETDLSDNTENEAEDDEHFIFLLCSWLDAIENLETAAFVGGYEINTLLHAATSTA